MKTTLADAPLVKIDPVPSVDYPDGGAKSLVELGPVAGGVSAKALTAASNLSGRGEALKSKATLAEVVIKDILRAKLVTAECEATGNGDVRGSSAVAHLKVLGQPIDTTTVGPIDVLGVAKVMFNEQIRSGNTLTVNAVHVIVGGTIGNVLSADIVLSQARCTAGRGTQTTPPTATTTTKPTTTTTTGTATTVPSTSSSSGPGTITTSHDAGPGVGTGDNGQHHDVTPAANDENLAETGVSGLLPMILIGAVLLGGGLLVLFRSRRGRPAKS